MNNREQLVKIGKDNSTKTAINTGQSTILRPLFFTIYLNDIFVNAIENCEIKSYADDTVIICKGSKWEKLKRILDRQSNIIDIWLMKNALVLNKDKTVYITFGSYADGVPMRYEVKLDDRMLQRVESTKYLGIEIDYKLNWENEIRNKVKKNKYLIYIIAELS